MKHRFLSFLLVLSCLVSAWTPIGAYAFQAQHWVPTRPRSTQVDSAYLISLIQSRAKVCGIQFDDGNVTHYTRATPILLQYGLIGSFGIVTGNTNVNPGAMTDAQIWEMRFVHGYHFQDHTWNHDAAFWGNPAYSETWQVHTEWSREVFFRIGFEDTMRAWNQPGGPGEGWSNQLRSHLKSNGMWYAAGRVGLNSNQYRNMHFGAIDDPFSWGRWCYSWTYNAPAMALEAQGVDLFTPEGNNLLEATAAIINGEITKSDMLLPQASPMEMTMVQEIAAAWTWQAEVEVLKQRYADAWAAGGFPIVVFHTVDEAHGDAPAGLDALCAWLVEVGAVVLGMDDLNALALLDRSYQHGLNIAMPLGTDLNGDGQQDGDDPYTPMLVDGTSVNGSPGTYYMGTPEGKLVVTTTITPSAAQVNSDDFSMYYEKYVIDPVTWAYTSSQEARLHTLMPGQAQTFTDTLVIDERVDRVKHWVAGINSPNLPFVINELSAVPISNPTGVGGRTPQADLAVKVTPNPTDGQATISFHLDEQTNTTVEVYDVHGRFVERLVDNQSFSGDVSVSWSNSAVAAGVYFLRVTAGTVVKSGKFVLVR